MEKIKHMKKEIVPERTVYYNNVNRPAHYLHGKKETIDVIS